uniref:DUF3328 protein n=1 Tax=Diaporthe leptostromiformis TaxID=291059 RepID=A0A142I727_DIALO|nr:DUF3328 protein [Diaporthe leptostromiformis]
MAKALRPSPLSINIEDLIMDALPLGRYLRTTIGHELCVLGPEAGSTGFINSIAASTDTAVERQLLEQTQHIGDSAWRMVADSNETKKRESFVNTAIFTTQHPCHLPTWVAVCSIKLVSPDQ